MPQVVFLSLFFGLLTGVQSVTVQVQPAVALVRIELGGREVARMMEPPWTTRVDFGRDLLPQQLTAIAYDRSGNELERASQPVNISRPAAEMAILITSEGPRPVAADLVGRHRMHSDPTKAMLTLDGKPVELNRRFHATLPVVDTTQPHVLAAAMTFADGEVAHKEIAIAAGFSGLTHSELAPLLVTTGPKAQPPSGLENCFAANDVPLRATVVETGEAQVTMVKDPISRGRLARSGANPFGSDVEGRILWPVSRPINAAGEPTAIAFPQSVDHNRVHSAGWLLVERLFPAPVQTEPRQFADAVAVAGIGLLERARRRAVVLVLSPVPDHSLYSAAMVRRYLASIGVPLFVWSAEAPVHDDDAWGHVDDISTAAALDAAVFRLNNALSQQRIVWVAADPITALHARTVGQCGLSPVAQIPLPR